MESGDGSGTLTVVGTGNWLVFDAEAPSDPITLVTGRFTLTQTFDADGNLVSSEDDLRRARVVDMCEVLASRA